MPERNDLACGAQQKCLHRRVVGRDAIDGEVSSGSGRIGDLALGELDAVEKGHLAVVVDVDTDPEVHLARVGVAVEGFGDAKNRIARCEIDGTEE